MFKNIVWDLFGKFGSQLVSFGISIILTRLLSPQEFGIMGMAMVIIGFAHVFMDLGFQRAIIQHQDISPVQLSTIFYINAFMALLLTVTCFFLSAPIARFYNQPFIEPVFKVVSISFLLNGLNLIPSALIYKNLKLKANSIIVLFASVVSGISGIIMAYNGYGVWSLVLQSLLSSFLILVLNSLYIKWKPKWSFNLGSIKKIWQFGSRLFASGVLDTLYMKLDTFIVGKIFSPAALGYYSRAQSMDNFVRQFSANSIMGSLFPFIAKHQHDRPYLKEVFVRYLHFVMFVSIGLCGLLFLIARDMFTILFTTRWLLSAEMFQLMAIGGFVWPVSSLMVNIISGVGNSKIFFRLEVYKKLLFLPVYFFGFLWGIKGFIICVVSFSSIGLTLNALFAGREIDTSLRIQFLIMFRYLFIGTIAAFFTWMAVSLIPQQTHLMNIFLLASGFGLFYLAGSYILKLRGVYLINHIFQKLNPAL